MPTGLPYFKFHPEEWGLGNISFEPLEVQGLFIGICALYWQRGGKLTVEDVDLRFNKPTAFNSLNGRYLSVSENIISIKFLDKQFQERNYIKQVNAQNGKNGGRPKGAKNKDKKPTAFNSLTESKPNEKATEQNRRRKESPEILQFRGACRDWFKEHYLKTKNLDYIWGAADSSNLIKLLGKISGAVKKKNPTIEGKELQDAIFIGFKVLIEGIKDKWILDNLTIPIINGKFQTIFDHFKNGNNSQKEEPRTKALKFVN